MLNRRDFLKASSLLALAPSVPAFLADTARADTQDEQGRVLVVLQLDGGNDGLNTLVPFGDEGYARYRNKLRIENNSVIKLTDGLGLHPSLRRAAELWEKQQLAIVQGVGYPNPDRSHEVSMAIWHTARMDAEEHNGFGWIGRGLDSTPLPSSGAPSTLLIGRDDLPVAVRGRRSVSAALDSLGDLTLKSDASRRSVGPLNREDDDARSFVRRSALDAYVTADRLSEVARHAGAAASYPSTELATRLRLIAQLIKADFGTRVYYAVQSGYDTHYAQLAPHAELLAELGGGLQAFLDDLTSAGLADRVLVLCFSEFGRRVQENASLGTDHGTSGPVFLAGGQVRAGLHGTSPSLLDLEDGDLKMSVDFRQVYASVLSQWMKIDPQHALGGAFESLPLL